MFRYDEGFKEAVLRKLVGPNRLTFAEACGQTGVSEKTLRRWHARHLERLSGGSPGRALDGRPRSFWEGVVKECEGLEGQTLADYCQGKGVYLEEVESWRASLSGASLPASSPLRDNGRWRRRVHELERENRALRDGLSRATRALAESAMRALLGDGDAR